MNLYLNLTSFIPVIFLLILSAMGIVLGDYFAKCWSENHEILYFFTSPFTLLSDKLKKEINRELDIAELSGLSV